MPSVIAPYITTFLVSKGIVGFGSAVLTNLAIEAGLYLFAGRYLYRRAQPHIPDITIPLNSRNQYLVEPHPQINVVYGEASLAPTVLDAFSNDTMLNMITAIAPHPLEEVVDIKVNDHTFFSAAEISQFNIHGSLYVDNNSSTDEISELRAEANRRSRESGLPIMFMAKDFTAANPGNFAEKSVTIGQNAGTERPAFGNDGRGISPTQLNYKCSGLSWIYLQFPRSKRAKDPSNNTDPDVWGNVPNLVFKVRRSNASLMLPEGFDAMGYARSNTALAAYDFLKRYTSYGESVCGYDRIDEASFRTAAMFCETQGNAPDQRNYPLTCDGVVSLTTDPASTLDDMALAMNVGAFPEHAGIRYFAPGSPSEITQTITDDDIIKDSYDYSLLSPVESRVSTYITRYVDGNGVEQSAGANYDTDATTASQEINLSLVNHNAPAEQIARILLARIWSGATLSFRLNDSNVSLRPYDKIRVRGCGPLNLDDVFRVLSIERGDEGDLSVQCHFERADLFEHVYPDDTYIPPSKVPSYRNDGSYRINLNGVENRLIVRPAGSLESSFLRYY